MSNPLESLNEQLEALKSRIYYVDGRPNLLPCAGYGNEILDMVIALTRQSCDALLSDLRAEILPIVRSPLGTGFNVGMDTAIAVVRKRFYGDAPSSNARACNSDVHERLSSPIVGQPSPPPLTAGQRYRLVKGMLRACESLGDLEDCMSAALAYLETQLNLTPKE